MEVNRALIAGLVVVVLRASALPAIRVAPPVMGVIGLSFARLLVAALALLVLAVIAKARLPRTMGPRPPSELNGADHDACGHCSHQR